MKCFDSFQTPNINLMQLLNLNFNTGKLKYILQPSGPTFKVTVDTNTFFSIPEELPYESKLYIYMNKNTLWSAHLFDYIYLQKNETYKFVLVYRDKRKKKVIFLNQLDIYFYMEEINFKNNSFRINDFTTYNYLILNIKNYTNISFFIKDNSEIIHQNHKMIMISESECDNFIINIKYKNIIPYKKITNSEIKK